MKKEMKYLLAGLTGSLVLMKYFNDYIDRVSTQKNVVNFNTGNYFVTKQGRIYYTKHGNGKPILFLHDINCMSSSIEWSELISHYSKNHTVYTLDLLGCGRSDKPPIVYTNYLYVQMITEFVHKVIQTKTDVVASHRIGSSVLFANSFEPDLFDKIIMINPHPIHLLKQGPDLSCKVKKALLQTPVLGKFIYNILMQTKNVDRVFAKIYYKEFNHAKRSVREAFYEGAHKTHGKGRFLYASCLSNYVNMDVENIVKKTDKQVTMIGSAHINSNIMELRRYHELNPKFVVKKMYGVMLLPQLENPRELIKLIDAAL